MTQQQNALENIIFISLPPSMERDINNFHVDSSIKIPVQLPDGKKQLERGEEITLELIIAGMLKILAYQGDHPHLSYYRSFVLAVQPDAPQELNMAAIAQEQKQNYEFAEELFLVVSRLAPQGASYVNLATLYSRMAAQDNSKGERYDHFQQKALQTLKEGLEVVGDDEQLLREIGFFHLYQGNVEIAKEYLDRYLEEAPAGETKNHVQKILDDINAKLNDDQRLMQAYDAIQMNKEDEALDLLAAYLEHNSEVWNAHFLKGWALRRLSRFQEAEEAFLAALAKSKGNSDIYNELAICNLETGKAELAKTYLNTAVDLDGENLTLISNLAYLHLKDGELDEAREFLELARNLDPNDPVILQLIEDYERESGETISFPVVQEFMDTAEVISAEKREKPFAVPGKEETDDIHAEFSEEEPF